MNQSIVEPLNIKLVVVGDGSVGKTCILLSYTTDNFPTEYVPTVFENYTTQTALDGKMINLSLWDTAGQETYNKLRTLSYNQSDVFLIVFSVVDPNSFENALNKWYPELCTDDLLNVPKLFVGNKIDMRNSEKDDHLQKQAAEQNIREKAGGCQYLECSALTQEGLKEIFVNAVKCAVKAKLGKSQATLTLHSEAGKDQKDIETENKCYCSTF